MKKNPQIQIRRQITERLAEASRGDCRTAELLALSVGRIAESESRDFLPYNWISESELRLVASWMKVAVNRNLTWLSNIDSHGRPHKLLALQTMSDCINAARADLRDEVENHPEEHEIHLTNLEEGYTLVRLLTQGSLERENTHQRYQKDEGDFEAVLAPGTVYLALRDGTGKTQAILELENENLTSIKKSVPNPNLGPIIPYAKEQGWKPDGNTIDGTYVLDAAGDWHHIDNLPNGLNIRGKLNLVSSKARRLPKNMTVTGSLYLSNSDIEEIPENLTVRHKLVVPMTKITRIPASLIVHRDIIAYQSQIADIPENFTAKGDMNLTHTPIQTLSAGLSVKNALSIVGTAVNDLPDDLNVGVKIIFEEDQIRRIPDTIPDSVKVLGWDSQEMTAGEFREKTREHESFLSRN